MMWCCCGPRIGAKPTKTGNYEKMGTTPNTSRYSPPEQMLPQRPAPRYEPEPKFQPESRYQPEQIPSRMAYPEPEERREDLRLMSTPAYPYPRPNLDEDTSYAPRRDYQPEYDQQNPRNEPRQYDHQQKPYQDEDWPRRDSDTQKRSSDMTRRDSEHPHRNSEPRGLAAPSRVSTQPIGTTDVGPGRKPDPDNAHRKHLDQQNPVQERDADQIPYGDQHEWPRRESEQPGMEEWSRHHRNESLQVDQDDGDRTQSQQTYHDGEEEYHGDEHDDYEHVEWDNRHH